MTRVTFGVAASSFAANMSVWQNAIDSAHEYPLAARVVEDSFYVDDCLSGADHVENAITLYDQLRKLYTKALGIEWNTSMDHFHLTTSDLSSSDEVTKRILVSNIAKIFDVLGWFSPIVIKMKIRLWKSKIDWDDPVPPFIQDVWLQWKSELHLLSKCHVPQLPGFCDASEDAYAGVVYLRGEDIHGNVHVALVMSKTKVSPIKRLTIPRLELCGAYLLSKLLHHVKEIYKIPITSIYAWTDSTIVLNWLSGSLRRFKTYVGNRVSTIISRTLPTGIMSMVLSIPQIVLLEVSSQVNY